MKTFDADGSKIGRGREIPLGEIGKTNPIELVSEQDFVKAAELEAFMNQMLLIEVHTDKDKGSLDIITPSVNGVNQPIIRGKKQWVKRCYVEALARGTYTDYEQNTPDSSRPEVINMIERKVISYPFAVYEDPSPNGRAWLDSVLAAS